MKLSISLLRIYEKFTQKFFKKIRKKSALYLFYVDPEQIDVFAHCRCYL